MARDDDELAAYEALIAEHSQSDDPLLREEATHVRFQRASKLRKLGRRDEAITAYRELIELSDDSTDFQAQVCVAAALVGLGRVLGELGRRDDELACYRRVVARYSGATESELREEVALALIYSALARHKAGELEAELTRGELERTRLLRQRRAAIRAAGSATSALEHDVVRDGQPGGEDSRREPARRLSAAAREVASPPAAAESRLAIGRRRSILTPGRYRTSTQRSSSRARCADRR